MVLEAPGPLVVISAPAGYGKSVLALTVARSGHYTHASWVDCSELDVRSGQLWRAIARAVNPELIPDDPAGASPLIAAYDVQESEAALLRALQQLPNSPVCVVLDNMTLEPDASGYTLANAAAELARCTHSASRIVVTSRCDSAHIISALGANAVVSADILRFSDAETRALVDGVAGDEWDHALVAPLRELTGGQAAMLSILARHVASGTLAGLLEGTLSLDVKSQLVQLSAQLSAESLEILYVASMLGYGTAAEVRQLLPVASSRTLQSIADVIPLFRVGGGTSPGTFVVHDLAVAVFTDSEYAALNVRGYHTLRDSALRELDYLGRYELLFSRLLQEEDDEQLAEWVEKRGRRLLERGNLKLLRAVLDGVGAKGGLRRPRVLLLYAGLLRELAEFSEALRKAVVAKDLAFTEAERDVRQDALLMIARLRIDLGFLGEAAVSLEAFLESNQADLANPDSLALAHAYLSACYAYTGRTTAAAVEAERARTILDRVESEDTVARVFLCLEGAVGVMGGRWDCALALCGRLLDEEMVSMGLRMQVMMNYGTALNETGQLEHARTILVEVFTHCRSVGLHAMEYTCLGSIASTHAGTGNYELAEENAVLAVRLTSLDISRSTWDSRLK
jgi:ATP/maltotriose-dependent transcriptional regulator MalT